MNSVLDARERALSQTRVRVEDKDDAISTESKQSENDWSSDVYVAKLQEWY